jgi:hypothetical protein
LPEHVDGNKTPHYDDVIGTRIVDLLGVGQFILTNPKTQNDGIKEIKTCTAYSLEYEFTSKKLSLEEATYNFWNPVARDDTILGIIMERMPSWSVGAVDSDLIGRYRTFDVSDSNLYNFIKSTCQESYQCVFEFDTYARLVNVRSVKSMVATRPVYLSFDNLIKSVDIEENSEGIVTCLNVYGADGIDVRNVNPMGTNKIYDLRYFMNTTNFSSQFIEKYDNWKATFESYQLPYYNLSVESALKITERLTEEAALAELNGQLKNLENQQAVIIQSIAQGLRTQGDLNAINNQISSKNTEINAKNTVIAGIEAQIDGLMVEMAEINEVTAFSAFFESDELLILDRYIKEDGISDSSFVAPAVKNYNTPNTSATITNAPYSITGATVTRVTNSFGKDIYTVSGGTLSTTAGIKINAEVVKASYEVDGSGSFLFTAYFKSGVVDTASFPSGCISLTGTISGATFSDVQQDAQLPQYYRGTRVSFNVNSARFFFTQNTTIYEQRAVEWDLYDYGRECLERLCAPAYTFSVSMADFLSLEEFTPFKNSVVLGDKVYLNLDDDTVIQPIAVKCVIDFDNHTGFKFEFGNTYRVTDGEFRLLDILDQSISMGSKLDLAQYTYSAWVESGAETSVSHFITSALDVAKNAILSSRGQAPTFDETGLRIRRRLDDGTYDPKQMWAVSNSLMFTSDNWQTAELVIGEFTDENAGSCWGIVAKSIVGTLLAGNNLIIESEKKDGDKSVFRVDGDGAALYNATFDLYNGANTQITINPYTGFAIGKYPLYTGDGYTINTDNAKFWVDMDGNVHLKGTLHGVDGTFSGELSAATGRFTGVVQAADFQDSFGRSMLVNKDSPTDYKFDADYLSLLGLDVGNGNLIIDSGGNISMRGNITMTGGSISWGNVNTDPATTNAASTAASAYSLAYGANSAAANAAAAAATSEALARRIANGTFSGGTFIDGQNIYSPTIYANEFVVNPRTSSLPPPSFSIFGTFNSRQNYSFRLRYYAGDAAYVIFESPGQAYAQWNFPYTYFSGNIDFSRASVYGIQATFA